MRLIDADELIEEFEWLKGVVNKYNRPHIEETIERINEAPTVDAVPVVHGRWESEELFEEPNFCPNCGADMREKQ